MQIKQTLLILYLSILFSTLSYSQDIDTTGLEKITDFHLIVWSCKYLGKKTEKVVVIKNRKEYKKFIDEVVIPQWGNIEYPKINFNESIFMAFRVSSGGCRPPIINHNMYYNKKEKTVIYNASYILNWEYCPVQYNSTYCYALGPEVVNGEMCIYDLWGKPLMTAATAF